ncbi:phage tail tube assembly chaperone [Weissella hellenica]|uniref:phage tail tube assembly chaperone n=1 Tax=Weissella hellenica TaxID=46256 RepID=UPI00388B0F3D
MNIKISQLQAKPFSVKGSLKNLKKTYTVLLDMAKLEADSEQQLGVEGLEAILKFENKLTEYLTDILKLSVKQQDSIEELEQNEVVEIVQYVAMRLMGMSDENITDSITNSVEDTGLVIPEAE